MIVTEIAGKEYHIEFRHITKYGKNAQLRSRAPIRAISTCVIVSDYFIAIPSVRNLIIFAVSRAVCCRFVSYFGIALRCET